MSELPPSPSLVEQKRAYTKPSSAIDCFVLNLHILGFDRKPGWPSITVKTLTAEDDTPETRIHRHGCVEWALYNLFSLWNPAETTKVGCSL